MKDDKKKVVVLGLLVVVVLGVGAFQFTMSGSPAPAAKAKAGTKQTSAKADGKAAPEATPTPTPDAKGADPKVTTVADGTTPPTGDPATEEPEKEPVANPQVANALPQRDPFAPATLPGATPDPTVVPPQQTEQRQPPAAAARPPRRQYAQRPPSIPPFPIDKTGPLPAATADGAGVTVQPAGPDPEAFGYRVSGLIVGNKPAAVFTDANGNQRLVTAGGSLDGDRQVVRIERGHVTVRYRGKNMRLTVGGNPQ